MPDVHEEPRIIKKDGKTTICMSSYHVPSFRVAMIGSSKATFEQSEKMIKKTLKGLIRSDLPYLTEIINTNCKGIDKHANKIATDMHFTVKPIKTKSSPNFWNEIKLANEKVSEMAHRVYVFVLPVGTTEGKGKCTFCEKAGLDYNHEKSVGCKTAINSKVFKICTDKKRMKEIFKMKEGLVNWVVLK